MEGFLHYLMIRKQKKGIRSSHYIRTALNNSGAGGPGIAKVRVKFRLSPDWYLLYTWNCMWAAKSTLYQILKQRLI